MKSHIEKMYEEAGNVHGLTRELHIMARSFAATGNAYVSKELHDIAVCIDNSVDAMTQAVSDDLNDQFKQSQKSMGDMLVAVLNRCEQTSR